MNITKMIAELRAEKERLDEAIVALERLSASSRTRRRAKLRQATGEVNEPEIEPIKARSQSS
jgi:hypothetical protein